MNLFPCRVTLPDGTQHSPVRVVSDGDTTTVWAWQNGGPEAVATIETEPVQLARTMWNAGGVTVRYDPSSCGCGHPLKHWRPKTALRERARVWARG